MSRDLCGVIDPFSVNPQDLSVILNSRFKRINISLISTTKAIDRALWQDRLEDTSWWDVCLEILKPAIEFYGQGNVEVQLGLGLGETEEQVMVMAQHLHNLGAKCLIVPATNIKEYQAVGPDYFVQKVSRGKLFRLILGNELIGKGLCRVEQFKFNEFGQILNWGMIYEDLLPRLEWAELFDLNPSDLLKEMVRFDFTEAWETEKRRIILEGIDFDEDEIEEGSGSIYKFCAQLAENQDVETN